MLDERDEGGPDRHAAQEVLRPVDRIQEPDPAGSLAGRPTTSFLDADGVEGVVRGLGELRDELVESMRLSGCPILAETRGIACPDRGFGL